MSKESAPPMEPELYQQGGMAGMPDAPPSYEQSTGPGGFHPPPPNVMPPTNMYPPLPPAGATGKGVPIPAMAAGVAAGSTTRTQVEYLPAMQFGHRPVTMVCPHCQQSITTSTTGEPSVMAYVLGAFLCFVGCWICACVPCCVDSMQQVTHNCPNCKHQLGRYSGSG